MPRYRYLAIDSRGKRVSGELDAADPDALVSQVTSAGLRIENIEMLDPTAEIDLPGIPESPARPALSAAQTIEIGGHIAELAGAGLPLESGLAAIAPELPHGRARRVLRGLVRRLRAGDDLSHALAAEGAPPELRALIRAGARAGRIGEVLEQYVSHTQGLNDLRWRLAMGLAYPLLLLAATGALAALMFCYIIPQFTAIFADFGIELPFLTVALVQVSRVATRYGVWIVLGVTAGLTVLTVVATMSLGPVGTRMVICRIPGLGPILRWSALSRFSHLMSILVRYRVPLPESLELSGNACGDAELRHGCRHLAASVRNGEPLSLASPGAAVFPRSFIQALVWSRNHASFPEALGAVGDLFASRARTLIPWLVSILAPLLVLFVGLVIGLIVIALFMPLIQLLNSLS
jgi:type IV pilus assembly protein PilC